MAWQPVYLCDFQVAWGSLELGLPGFFYFQLVRFRHVHKKHCSKSTINMVGTSKETVLYDRYENFLTGSWGPCTEQTPWSFQTLFVLTTNSLRKVDTSFLGAVNLYYLSWEDLTVVLSHILVQLSYIKVHSCLRMCSISNVFKRLLSIIGLIGSYTSGALR